jgi:peptidoglycan hydrolase CwlO-like protein
MKHQHEIGLEELEKTITEKVKKLQSRITQLEGDKNKLDKDISCTKEAYDVLAERNRKQAADFRSVLAELDSVKKDLEARNKLLAMLVQRDSEVAELKAQRNSGTAAGVHPRDMAISSPAASRAVKLSACWQ